MGEDGIPDRFSALSQQVTSTQLRESRLLQDTSGSAASELMFEAAKDVLKVQSYVQELAASYPAVKDGLGESSSIIPPLAPTARTRLEPAQVEATMSTPMLISAPPHQVEVVSSGEPEKVCSILGKSSLGEY
jgi:hypothetical protein